MILRMIIDANYNHSNSDVDSVSDNPRLLFIFIMLVWAINLIQFTANSLSTIYRCFRFATNAGNCRSTSSRQHKKRSDVSLQGSNQKYIPFSENIVCLFHLDEIRSQIHEPRSLTDLELQPLFSLQILQSLANNVLFTKEKHMEPLNEFLKENLENNQQ